MTIEYALTRAEIVKGFFRSLKNSPKYLAKILVYLPILTGFFLLLRAVLFGPIRTSDIVIAMMWAIAVLVLMPVGLFLRGKTKKRILVTSPDGIYTEIGEIRANVPWRKVKVVACADEYVLIAGLAGNAFYVPNRAFSSPANRDHFIDEIHGWMGSEVVKGGLSR